MVMQRGRTSRIPRAGTIAALGSAENASPAAGARGQQWNQFRGPNGDGMSEATGLPVEFGESSRVRWKTAIHDEGWSSPVIWGDQIWLTAACADGSQPRGRRHLRVRPGHRRGVVARSPSGLGMERDLSPDLPQWPGLRHYRPGKGAVGLPA